MLLLRALVGSDHSSAPRKKQLKQGSAQVLMRGKVLGTGVSSLEVQDLCGRSN